MNSALIRLTQPLAQRVLRPDPLRQQVRSFADGVHGEVKVNCWEAPLSVGKWKEEHIVLVVLASWGVVIYSSMKMFGGKKENALATAPAPAH